MTKCRPANCTMFRLEGHKYWKDSGSGNQTSEGMSYKPQRWFAGETWRCCEAHIDFGNIDWKDEKNTETIADVLRVLDDRGGWPRAGAGWVTWAALLVKRPFESSVTCKQSILNVLATFWRTNVLFSRCGVSRNSLGMRIRPLWGLWEAGRRPPAKIAVWFRSAFSLTYYEYRRIRASVFIHRIQDWDGHYGAC